MPYIIDGHNLIPKIPGLGLGNIDDENKLIKVLQDFCRKQQVNADVYFDNAPPGSVRTRKHGRVVAHFIRQGKTADDAIRSHLRKIGREARNWTIISSDREIAAASREAGARVISADDFTRKHLYGEPRQGSRFEESEAEKPFSPGNIEEWLNIFGADHEKT